MTNRTITIGKISVDSIGSRIKQLEQDWNKSFRSIEFIQNSILIGFEQSPDFIIGNAYCQKAGHLVNTVNKFSPDKAKKVIAFFDGKIPFPILSRDGEYRIGKLNWDLMKTPDELEQAQALKLEKQKERNDKTAANAAEKKAKLAAFDTLTKRVDEKDDELKKLKLAYTKALQEIAELKGQLEEARQAKA